jgi:hypothetical protein
MQRCRETTQGGKQDDDPAHEFGLPGSCPHSRQTYLRWSGCFAALTSFLLILLPQHFSNLRVGGGRLSVFLYFALIGTGFFFVEMPFIQKSILFLHHPTYSLSVILSTLLIGSGVGSYCSDRLFGPRYRILFSTLILISILILYSFLLGPAMELLCSQPDSIKILLTILCLMPLGFLMGIPFPQGLSIVKDREAAVLPWDWGLNGFFLVISVILANVLAIQRGFPTVLLLAAACYLGAGVFSLRLSPKDQQRESECGPPEGIGTSREGQEKRT